MSDSTTERLAGSLFICMIGLMLISVSVVFEWLMLRSYLNAKESRQWPGVEAVILSSDVRERKISGYPVELRFDVVFEYSYQGKVYSSTRLSPRGSKWTRDRDSVKELTQKYPVGSSHNAWVDPKSPDAAILKHDSKAAGYTLWFPVVIMVGGGGMIWGALRSRQG